MKRGTDYLTGAYAFGIKKRDWNTGKILGLELMNKEVVNGKDVLIIDDICSRGGTFYHSAKALKEAGAKNIYLYVTHCENTILDGDLLTSGLIEKVYTTNSIFTKEHEKIEVFEL
jgi:ribose-phosphate pyrophosphokinase